ncbi:MAG: hypothetical protein J6K37_03835 [Lachnospiraceae bacterium]|nr:hypothetical protein [Lachnospiraceae bacterium]
MGTTSEDYLDSLLRAAMEPVSKEEKVEEIVDEVVDEPVTEVVNEPIAEVVEQPVEDTYSELNQDEQLSTDDLAALFSSASDSEPEPVEEPEPVAESEPEPVVEETSEEPLVEEEVAEENPLSVDEIDAMIAALDTESEPVAISDVMPIDDNPNKQLSADEIAAMFAAASGEPAVTEPVVEETSEEPLVEEEVAEENPLSVDEIDAMIAALDVEPEPEPVATPVDDNPNRQLSADEIAAMFAAASGEPLVEENNAENTAEDDAEVSGTEDTMDDLFALADVEEEMEIDLDNVDDLDALLGLREIPEERHWDEESGQMVEGKAEEPEELPTLDAEAGDMDDLAALLAMTGDAEQPSGETDDLAALGTMMGTEDLENQELSDLLSMLGDDDGDLAEIGDLLQKSDNHEIVEDDEMLALLGGLDNDADTGSDLSEVAEPLNDGDDAAVEKPKKKLFGKKKKEKKEKKDKQTEASQEESVQPEAENKPKEKGFFGKLFEALTEEVEDEEELLEAAIESEGLPMDKKAKNKKKKDKKNKKDKKGKENAASNDEILEEMDEEDAAKAKGKKKGGKGGKPKKAKKEKKVKEPVVEEPGKKLPKKMIIRIFILCFSLLAILILVTVLLPHLMQMSDARKAFYKGNYEEAYQGLAGQELNESDQILLKKAEILAQLERKTDAYVTYQTVGKDAEALNALFEGVAYYWEQEAHFAEYGIQDEANTAYAKILILLQDDHQINEETAKEIIAMDSIEYTYTVRGLASGEIMMESPEATESENGEEESAEPLEDLLEDEQ